MRNLQGWNSTLNVMCRRNMISIMAISDTGVTDTLMEVYKFRRALTEITGMELYICITMCEKGFELLTQIVPYRAADFAAKNVSKYLRGCSFNRLE